MDMGPVARLIAAVAVAREEVARSSSPFRRRALRAAEDMLACPCAEHRAAAQLVGDEAHEVFRAHGDTWDDAARATWHELGAPWFAAQVAADDARHQPWDRGTSWRDSPTWRARLSDYLTRTLVAASASWSVDDLFRMVSSALIPWALSPRSRWSQELPELGVASR